MVIEEQTYLQRQIAMPLEDLLMEPALALTVVHAHLFRPCCVHERRMPQRAPKCLWPQTRAHGGNTP